MKTSFLELDLASISKSCLYILEYVEFSFDWNLSFNNGQEMISLLGVLNKNKHMLVIWNLILKVISWEKSNPSDWEAFEQISSNSQTVKFSLL